ncbi:RNA-binding S4 domain-containing protein [Clostridium sp. Marseille-P3244]|mgnify:CR=1 FL=1|uniref:RNA-binding S4 domain-containing protein n=1 Tax=Clostridium sp. Marseille-P3244 TaxID=1871020 RepID=UPI0009307BB1|nr:RNA-binding S4 domain-containing protein [Clostridium sp. Marseille-P3244]
MEMFQLRAEEGFIRLGQVLKASGIADSGAEAKQIIQSGEVCVNGEIETRRGRKLYKGDILSFGGREIEME